MQVERLEISITGNFGEVKLCVFEIDPVSINKLVMTDEDQINLEIQQGKMTMIEGVYAEKCLLNGKENVGVFFDNAKYPIWVEFKDYVNEARFGSMLKSDNDCC